MEIKQHATEKIKNNCLSNGHFSFLDIVEVENDLLFVKQVHTPLPFPQIIFTIIELKLPVTI